MERYLVSVIVPVYKVERYLEQCVNSLLRQTYSDLEILLIDDGSPDNSPAICDSYAAQDSRIKVIHKNNGGLADARNTGIEHATGDLIAFVDSDDWIAPEMYMKMVQMFQNNPSVEIVCCAASCILPGRETKSGFSYYETGTILSGNEVSQRILLDEIGSQVWLGLYKRKCWENVRFPQGRLYEDIPTTFQAFLNAREVGFINEPFYKYRLNEKGISNTPKAIKPYHIYLGFKSHYDCAVEKFPEIMDRCCSKTAHYAISTYFHYCSEQSPELKATVTDVCQFLDVHKQEVLRERNMPWTRRVALRLYYFSKTIFKGFCRSFHLLGLQKIMGFGMK